ncbi:MAG: hypothetical protein MR450_03510 [Prevotella sp.]|nr:hypothetical protein [Prevotella sp.]MDY4039166.1 hypothetical protein [Prevotella sp.]
MKIKKMFLGYFVLMATSCSNTNTVNILIQNVGGKDLVNPKVSVSIQKILHHLQMSSNDSLVLLNEKNLPVGYIYNTDSTFISFTVPVIKKGSQKTYSMNRKENKLVDNLFRFRHENILVYVK